MVVSRANVENYFRETPGFRVIPERYRERIIDFFLEDRHYFVDIADVRFVLDGATASAAFHALDGVVKFSRQKNITGIIGCNRHFDTPDEMSEWMKKVAGIAAEADSTSVFLTHLFGCKSDPEEEWYIVLGNFNET